jgi:hypothetical protein
VIGKEDGKIPEAITRYIVALSWRSLSKVFFFLSFFFPPETGPTKGSEISEKPAERNPPPSLSLSLSLPIASPSCQNSHLASGAGGGIADGVLKEVSHEIRF